jgi:hypothetical protein
MKKIRKLWIVAAILVAVVAWKGPQWLAFGKGVQAYLYGYPLITADMTERLMTAPAAIAAQMPGAAPVNRLAHVRDYPDHDFTAVVLPSADTLYSLAWLDLSHEPVLLHTPDMQGRWVLFGVLDAWSNAFASLGTRKYGSGERTYALVGPGWTGTLPEGVVRIDSPTNTAWLIGRTYTAGRKDFAAVHKVQDQYSLATLSQFGKADAAPPPAVAAPSAVDLKTPTGEQVAALGAAEYFDRLARLMKANPPAPADAPMVATLASLGIEAGRPFDFAALSESERLGLDSAVWFVKALFDVRIPGSQGKLDMGPAGHAFFKSLTELTDKVKLNVQNRWRLPLNLGDYGTDYPFRAIVTLLGYGANGPADAVYPLTWFDADGQKLNGGGRYVLHFDKANMPPAAVFWSVTLYTDEFFYFKNPMRRYALGDRDSLKFNADGSLDILVQKDKPDADKESNWLPAPPDGFMLLMRLYHPAPQVLDGRWVPPAVQRVAAH